VSILLLKAKHSKIVSTKFSPLMHCKKSFFCLRIGVIHLEKYPKIKGTFYLCPNQVGYCMELAQNQNCFNAIARIPLRVASEYLGVSLLVAQWYVG